MAMTSERWRRIEGAYHTALEREPEARPAFLVDACAVTRLRMNRHAPVVQDLTDRTSGGLAQMLAALSQAVQKLGQDLVGRDQPHFSKRLPSADYLPAVLIVRVKRRAPVERISEDQPHFFFGAPWR